MRKYLAVLVFLLTCGSAFGALQVASGTFAVPVSTGSVTCTTMMGGACTAFTPKALLLFGSYSTADGFKTHADFMFFVSDCSSGAYTHTNSEDAANPS